MRVSVYSPNTVIPHGKLLPFLLQRSAVMSQREGEGRGGGKGDSENRGSPTCVCKHPHVRICEALSLSFLFQSIASILTDLALDCVINEKSDRGPTTQMLPMWDPYNLSQRLLTFILWVVQRDK
jgi:hypothetical protein